MNTDLVARQGVEEVRSAFVRDLGWYPREPSDPDYGIDVYVECADDGVPNGRLFGVQVKSGDSFFSEEVDDGMVFRGNERHLEYWLNHSLPIILVLYEPKTKTAYWQVVSESTTQTTGKGWKVTVPRSQVLGAGSAQALMEIAAGDPYVLRLNALRSDLSWMTALREEHDVVVEVAEWVNKSSGRGEIHLLTKDHETQEDVVRSRAVFFGLAPYADVLPTLFPWADLSIDDDVYDWHEEDLWQLEEGVYDSEEGRVIMVGASFEDWREFRGLTGLRPYTVEQDEVAKWRLRLRLNDLGRSFLTLNDYLGDSPEA